MSEQREQPLIEKTSFSRLSLYSKCSQRYSYKYIQPNPIPEPFQDYFAKGTLVHSALELFLIDKAPTVENAFYDALVSWLEKEQLDFGDDFLELFQMLLAYAEVAHKATKDYQGADAIRNKGGDIPKDVWSFPPAAFTQALAAAGVPSLRMAFDNAAAMQNDKWRSISVVNMLGAAAYMVLYFKKPSWLKRTLAVEMPFSNTEDDLVVFLQDERFLTYFDGFIDWVAESNDDKLIIADHKTGKTKPTPQDVLHHPQLNMYAYFYHEVYGRWPDVLAINHMLTHEYIFAQVDVDIVQSVVSYFRGIQKQIKQSSFVRHLPTEYNTPCIRKDYKTGAVVESCPYLERCWPYYAEMLY